MFHNQGEDKFVYTCNSCKSHIKTRYHCPVCGDFDLCVPCYDKESHPHKMEKLDQDLEGSSSPGDMKQANPPKARPRSVQECIQSLVHACHCRDANCRLPSCPKMKRVVAHTKICKRKLKGECIVCNEVIGLWLYHAEQCQETKCSVPFCTISRKQKIKQQQIQQRAQQQQLLRRRMAAMNIRCGAKHALHAPSAIKQRLGAPQKQQQQQPTCIHQKTLQQLMATLRSSACNNQHQEILKILKSNPPLMAAFIKQRAQYAQNQQQKGCGVGPAGNVGVVNVVVSGAGKVRLATGDPQQPQQNQQMIPPQQQQRLQQILQMLPQQTQVGGVSVVIDVGGVEGVSGIGSPPAVPSPQPPTRPTPSEMLMMRQSPAPPAPNSPPDE